MEIAPVDDTYKMELPLSFAFLSAKVSKNVEIAPVNDILG